MNNETLLQIASAAAQKAYAPYSNFNVGAAVLLDNGEVVEGSNQENSSYGLSMCAERVALNYALSMNPTAKVMAVAVISISTDKVVTPCGACRQVMAEVALRQKKDFDVVMQSKNGTLVRQASQLLPLAFEF